jgi:hypothetical protein
MLHKSFAVLMPPQPAGTFFLERKYPKNIRPAPSLSSIVLLHQRRANSFCHYERLLDRSDSESINFYHSDNARPVSVSQTLIVRSVKGRFLPLTHFAKLTTVR